MRKARIALVQTHKTKRENTAHVLKGVQRAIRRGAQIICLEELFRTHYFCQSKERVHFKFAESIPGPSTDALADLARTHKVVIIVPIFEKTIDNVYHNTAVVLGARGQILGQYRKMHIPNDPCFYEKYYFSPGDLGFRIFETPFARIGVLICWDQWFPEAARVAALKGAEILFYPTAIGSLVGTVRATAQRERANWHNVQAAHAVTNAVFVAAVNRVGREDNVNFWGSSFVAGPDGRILAQAPTDSESVLVTDCALDQIKQVRREWPFLRDRRTDAYGALLNEAS